MYSLGSMKTMVSVKKIFNFPIGSYFKIFFSGGSHLEFAINKLKNPTNYYHANNAVASSILYLPVGIKQMVYARSLRPKLSLSQTILYLKIM